MTEVEVDRSDAMPIHKTCEHRRDAGHGCDEQQHQLQSRGQLRVLRV